MPLTGDELQRQIGQLPPEVTIYGDPNFIAQDPNALAAAPPTPSPIGAGLEPPLSVITVTAPRLQQPDTTYDAPPITPLASFGFGAGVPVPSPRPRPHRPRRTPKPTVRPRPRRIKTRPVRFIPRPLLPPSESPLLSRALRLLGLGALDVLDVFALALMPGPMGPTQEEENARVIAALVPYNPSPAAEPQPFSPELPAGLPQPDTGPATITITAPRAVGAPSAVAAPAVEPLELPQFGLPPLPALATAVVPQSPRQLGIPTALGTVALPSPQPVAQPALAGCQCPPGREKQKKKKKQKRSVCYKGVYYERATGLTKHRKEPIPCR